MNRRKWFYRYQPDADFLDALIDDIEEAQRNMLIALMDTPGIRSGFEVTQRGAGINFSVDVDEGIAWDASGRRISNGATQNVPFTMDIYGATIAVTSLHERQVGVFVRYKIIDDPESATTDGLGDTVYTYQLESREFALVQGDVATIGASSPPATPDGGYIRLADVTIFESDTTIATGDINMGVKDVFTPYVP